MEKLTVLLTGAGAPGANGIINCLKRNGEREIDIIGVDMNEHAGGNPLLKTFYKIPKASDDNFIPKITEIARKENVQVIISIITRELEKFSLNKKHFEELGIKVSVMEHEQLSVANNKLNLLTKLRDIGMKTPDFVGASTVEEVIQGIKQMGYPEKPVCVKGAFGNGSRGIRILNPFVSKFDLFFNEKPNSMLISYNELIETLSERERIPQMMVMEYLPGNEYSVDLLCDKGKVLYIVGRHNTIVQSSIPLESRLLKNDDAYEQSKQIVEKLNLDGNIGLDFKMNGEGEPMLMEINPRLTATVVLNAVAGVNFPYLRIKQLLNEELPDCVVDYDVILNKCYTERFSHSDGTKIEF